MKRTFLFLLILLNVGFSEAQVQYAFFAGPQTTSALYLVCDMKQPTTFKFGLMAGGALKIPFEGKLSFFPSMYYSLKGYKVTLNDAAFPPSETAKNNNLSVHTVEIAPLFHIDLSRDPSHFFLRF